ncbi:hypothetical protein I5535_21290 [Rhodobacteraceae bacterium F11138]|nr:hypothetical protein [Rhodobacteraceae bacterium F11138]
MPKRKVLGLLLHLDIVEIRQGFQEVAQITRGKDCTELMPAKGVQFFLAAERGERGNIGFIPIMRDVPLARLVACGFKNGQGLGGPVRGDQAGCGGGGKGRVFQPFAIELRQKGIDIAFQVGNLGANVKFTAYRITDFGYCAPLKLISFSFLKPVSESAPIGPG